MLRAKLLRARDDDILDYNNILKLELGKRRWIIAGYRRNNSLVRRNR